MALQIATTTAPRRTCIVVVLISALFSGVIIHVDEVKAEPLQETEASINCRNQQAVSVQEQALQSSTKDFVYEDQATCRADHKITKDKSAIRSTSDRKQLSIPQQGFEIK